MTMKAQLREAGNMVVPLTVLDITKETDQWTISITTKAGNMDMWFLTSLVMEIVDHFSVWGEAKIELIRETYFKYQWSPGHTFELRFASMIMDRVLNALHNSINNGDDMPIDVQFTAKDWTKASTPITENTQALEEELSPFEAMMSNMIQTKLEQKEEVKEVQQTTSFQDFIPQKPATQEVVKKKELPVQKPEKLTMDVAFDEKTGEVKTVTVNKAAKPPKRNLKWDQMPRPKISQRSQPISFTQH